VEIATINAGRSVNRAVRAVYRETVTVEVRSHYTYSGRGRNHREVQRVPEPFREFLTMIFRSANGVNHAGHTLRTALVNIWGRAHQENRRRGG
jgi:hypothetical protein